MVGAGGKYDADKQVGSEDADVSHITANETKDGEWEGFGDEGGDRENLERAREKGKVGKLKPAKQKKGNKEKKQKRPTTNKTTSTAENSFATLEDAADDEANGKNCTRYTWVSNC